MQVTRIYTGDDGESHFDDVEVDLKSGTQSGAVTLIQRFGSALNIQKVLKHLGLGSGIPAA